MTSETNYTKAKRNQQIFLGFRIWKLKTEQPAKTIFQRALTCPDQKTQLMKVAYASQKYAHQNSGHSDIPVNSYEFNGEQQKSVSAQELNFSINFQLEP